jgi:hypothetical protein
MAACHRSSFLGISDFSLLTPAKKLCSAWQTAIYKVFYQYIARRWKKTLNYTIHNRIDI